MNKVELIETIKTNREALKSMNLRFRGAMRSSLNSWGEDIVSLIEEDERCFYTFEIVVSKSELVYKKGLVKVSHILGCNEAIDLDKYKNIDVYSKYTYKKQPSSKQCMEAYYQANGTKNQF